MKKSELKDRASMFPKDTRTPQQIEIEAERFKYAVQLGIVGVFDDTDGAFDLERENERNKAYNIIMGGGKLSKEMVDKLLRYKAEDEQRRADFEKHNTVYKKPNN